MRKIILPLVLLGTAAACAANNEPTPVNSAPPAISYQLNGTSVAAANAKAANYCGQYGLTPHLQSVEPGGSGQVAHYVCAGNANGAYGAVRQQPVKCADWLHQSRPGGSDYKGPPVPECMK